MKRLVLLVLLLAWISSVTILIYPPWQLDASLATNAVWVQWFGRALMVAAGALACALALRRGGSWMFLTAVMSAVYLIYWASEYVAAIRPVNETFSSVIHAIKDLGGFLSAVLIQLQFVLPVLHVVGLCWLLATNKRAAIAET